MLTLKQKANWLQKHYGDYSLSWYLANPSRLEVIYEREYTKYLVSLQQSIQQQQEEQIQERSMVDYEFNVHSNGLWGFSFKQGHQCSNHYRYGTSEDKEGVLLAIDMFIINASAVNNDNILQEIRDYLVETLAVQVSWSIN